MDQKVEGSMDGKQDHDDPDNHAEGSGKFYERSHESNDDEVPTRIPTI